MQQLWKGREPPPRSEQRHEHSNEELGCKCWRWAGFAAPAGYSLFTHKIRAEEEAAPSVKRSQVTSSRALSTAGPE